MYFRSSGSSLDGTVRVALSLHTDCVVARLRRGIHCYEYAMCADAQFAERSRSSISFVGFLFGVTRVRW